ncbi:MAG: DNA-binding protein [Verrucomicrobiota bacterium]
MAQLIVRRIEEELVRKLKDRARQHGVSTEEEHRRILREALLGNGRKKPSLKQYLRMMPNVGPDSLFDRAKNVARRGQQ